MIIRMLLLNNAVNKEIIIRVIPNIPIKLILIFLTLYLGVNTLMMLVVNVMLTKVININNNV
ncbi:hypothetical protein DY120_05250 [Apilactobacillus micheneri]|uniref:Uncharacterized protein n=1 Tax=Apilactobacillus micheneri TaxID=1899430 RepID=A0ABY2Z1V9_9LACO|nr:hypothetical protein DY114_05250 [Apilactobacillus micheneri]TPR25997.1 hypothetical protein DY111_05250 [Apilactobacillus micheneri]TPR28187.1 hypothetical protein DY113_03195 [Apilactobacillus micheneri]TPR29678.1 hypothetical protein DY117_05250 [Apilactobacillus micheneri]TPR30464.1 hypothetical protein DY120_05250 [Apilactobacillus micheneri]